MTTTNYRQSHFRIKEPSRIHGEPTFDTLKILYNNLKANATSVPSSKGGGRHGHLGLVVSPTEYALLSLTPFTKTPDPGEFIIPDNATSIDQVKKWQARHESQLQLFNKKSAVEAALKQFLSDSMEIKYLQPFINTTTQNIEYDIPYIIRSLFDDYGQLNSTTLMQKQSIMNNYIFDFTKPIIHLYNIAEDYQLYASMQNTTIDPALLISTVKEIIRKTGKFNSHIDKWDDKPPNEKTWDTFKSYFQQAQKKVRQHASTTTAEAGYANMVSDITDNVANIISETEATPEATNFLKSLTTSVKQNQQQLNQVTDYIKQLHQLQFHSMNMANSPNVAPPPPPQQPPFTPNVIPQPPPHNQPFNPPPFQQPYCPPISPQNQPPYMQYQQQNYVQPPNNNNNNIKNNNTNNNSSQSNRQRRRQFYCWTHGACNHPSSACRIPANGHYFQATFKNRYGGSNKGCYTM